MPMHQPLRFSMMCFSLHVHSQSSSIHNVKSQPARRINFIWTICGFTVSINDSVRTNEYLEPNPVHVKITCWHWQEILPFCTGGTATTTSTMILGTTQFQLMRLDGLLEKENFVHLCYSDACTYDVVAIENDPCCIQHIS